MSVRKFLFSGVALLSLTLSVNEVYAYDQNEVRSVKERVRSDYTATGGRFGAFILRPEITLEQRYDDNIFRDPQNEQSDLITVVKPELGVSSNWSLHDVRAGVSGRFSRYRENSTENSEDYTVFLSGRYDLDYATYLNARLSHTRSHIERNDVEDVQGESLVEYDIQSASLGFTRALGVVKLFLNSNYNSYSYDDSYSSGVRIDNSDRDYDRLDLSARVAYGTSDHYDIYVEGQYNTRSFEKVSTSYSDSDGYRLRLGSVVNLTGKMQADAYLGYLSQSYDHTFNDTQGVDFGGELLWNATDLTSVLLEAKREVRETRRRSASGILRTSGQVGVQHALRDNIIADSYVRYVDNSYKGGGNADGNDNSNIGTGFGFEYNMNPNVNADFNYDFSSRDYKSRDEDYTNHEMMISVRYAY